MVYRVKRFGLLGDIGNGVKTTAGGLIQGTGDAMKSGLGKAAGGVAGLAGMGAGASIGSSIGGAIGSLFGPVGTAVGAGLGSVGGAIAAPVLGYKAAGAVGQGLHNIGQDMKMG